jgi:DNA repair ATPase RecN
MPEQAHVSSVDALEAFRSSLIVYLSKARPALEEVSADVMRTRSWLEDEQRTHWENEMRRRLRALQEAQQALFSARLSTFREETSAEMMMVQRTKRAFQEGEEKLKVIKKWTRDYDNRVGPLLKQTEKLQTVLAHDMAHAVAFLTQAINALHAYAGVVPSSSTTAPGQSSNQEPTGGSLASADKPGESAAPPAAQG